MYVTFKRWSLLLIRHHTWWRWSHRKTRVCFGRTEIFFYSCTTLKRHRKMLRIQFPLCKLGTFSWICTRLLFKECQPPKLLIFWWIFPMHPSILHFRINFLEEENGQLQQATAQMSEHIECLTILAETSCDVSTSTFI